MLTFNFAAPTKCMKDTNHAKLLICFTCSPRFMISEQLPARGYHITCLTQDPNAAISTSENIFYTYDFRSERHFA